MRLRWLCCAGASCALLLILCASHGNPAAASVGDPGPAGWAAPSPGGGHDPVEDGSAAPEGAKKAIGWAVGLESGGYATILHTTNGGQTWERQGTPEEAGTGSLSGVAAVSATDAWAAGDDGANGLLIHTRDGGQHWLSEGEPADLEGNGLISVSAADLNNAWAVGEKGLVLHTTDGGEHWVRQGAGQVPAVGLNGVYAPDASHAWAVGPAEEGDHYGTIVYTADAGSTWTKVPYTVTHTPVPTSYYLITVEGAGADEVWAVGRDQVVHVTVSAAGMQTSDQTPAFSSMMDINGVFAVNRKIVWAVADTSAIWRSLNGGKAWKKAYGGPQNLGYVFRVSALDKDHAWATTGDQTGHGQILYTANGGKKWTSQQLPANPQMWGISFVK